MRMNINMYYSGTFGAAHSVQLKNWMGPHEGRKFDISGLVTWCFDSGGNITGTCHLHLQPRRPERTSWPGWPFLSASKQLLCRYFWQFYSFRIWGSYDWNWRTLRNVSM